jgi:hypothetical protein
MGTLSSTLKIWLQEALIAEIYPQIRAIAVGFSSDRKLTIRYYLDRAPIDFDYESLGMVVSEILSKTSSADDISAVTEECVFSKDSQADLDRLDGFLYARREYEMQDNQPSTPTIEERS